MTDGMSTVLTRLVCTAVRYDQTNMAARLCTAVQEPNLVSVEKRRRILHETVFNAGASVTAQDEKVSHKT